MQNDDVQPDGLSITSVHGTLNNTSTQITSANLPENYVSLMNTATTIEQTLEVIQQALEAPGVHAFGELLHMSNVQAVSI